MHQENQAIRCRCFYLFNRFVFTSRMQLHQHLSPDNVTSICSSVQDLLTIEASVPEPESPGDDVLTKAARKGSFFDSQLYLFEALGTLMSTLGNHQAEQVGLLRVSIALCRVCAVSHADLHITAGPAATALERHRGGSIRIKQRARTASPPASPHQSSGQRGAWLPRDQERHTHALWGMDPSVPGSYAGGPGYPEGQEYRAHHPGGCE